MDTSQVIWPKAHIPQSEAALLSPGRKATITVLGLDKPVEERSLW